MYIYIYIYIYIHNNNYEYLHKILRYEQQYYIVEFTCKKKKKLISK